MKIKKIEYRMDEVKLKDKEIIDYFNKLGQQGWDVIGVKGEGAYYAGKRETKIFMKRPI